MKLMVIVVLCDALQGIDISLSEDLVPLPHEVFLTSLSFLRFRLRIICQGYRPEVYAGFVVCRHGNERDIKELIHLLDSSGVVAIVIGSIRQSWS